MSGTGTGQEVVNPIYHLIPSDMTRAVEATINAGQTPFVWGKPGGSKSSLFRSIANIRKVALVAFHMANIDPIALRGVPYNASVGDAVTVRFSVPERIPVDLDYSTTVTISDPTDYRVHFVNPVGDNGIPYVQKVDSDFFLISDDPDLECVVMARGRNWIDIAIFRVASDGVPLFDKAGEPVLNSDGRQLKVEAGRRYPYQYQQGKVRVRLTGKAEAMLVFEEMSSAPPSIQAIFYDIVLERRIGAFKFPEGALFGATGNRMTDGGLSYKMLDPLGNRIVHLVIVTGARASADWQAWAVNEGTYFDIVTFLAQHPEKLLEHATDRAEVPFNTNRSWAILSDILIRNGYKPGQAIIDPVMRSLVVGTVGSPAASEFFNYTAFSKYLPKTEDIFSGKLKVLGKAPDGVAQDVYAARSLLLCSYRLKTEWEEVLVSEGRDDSQSAEQKRFRMRSDTMIGLIMRGLKTGTISKEVSLMIIQQCVYRHQLKWRPKFMPNLKQWLGDNHADMQMPDAEDDN